MPDSASDSIVIDKNNSGFPGYLDFNALRTSSIQYLSSLTGKIWTDYNVHDPGITILEALIYALLDLGYRTNLPDKDIFTRSAATTGADDNFFTPAEILACNPLTIGDFRKMLVDINGVKNAWAEIATDVKLENYCTPPVIQNDEEVLTADMKDCRQSVNGLYHIKLQLDDVTSRPTDEIVTDVRKVLLSHRNLCEDFFDIAVLCELNIGVCADIGLLPGADANEVCKNILIALRWHFSPAPIFYTLQQLLDKGKKIEEIFAGRPYDLENSNGFVDTAEFEAIDLKKEIHLSDVYNTILSVDGVDTVRRLKLKKEGGSFIEKWQFVLPEGYAPVFSSSLSSIQFSVNGISVPLNFEQVSTSHRASPENTTKLSRQPSEMDLPIPQGVYHNDLADYYSIQNEFPLIYGISNGGLPATASVQRQAQALQLKGYLLFFDQLLANYLSQLGNIRSLFSFRPPQANQNHTYYVNHVDSVPDLKKLLLNVSGQDSAGDDAKNGKVLGYPVWKKDFDELLIKGIYSSSDVNRLQKSFTCRTQSEYQLLAEELQSSFKVPSLHIISSKYRTADSYSFYKAEVPATDVLVIGELFADFDENPASADASLADFKLLPGMASIPANYHYYNAGNGMVSFNIRLNLLTYPEYLSQIVEDEAQYLDRRDGFLTHLFSRFAEQFSDFALLSYHFMDKNNLQKVGIQHKEKFLENYPALSSNRGRAFNYRAPAFRNTSGFEDRVITYTGIETGCCTSLCQFEVVQYDDTYSIRLALAGINLFVNEESWEGSDNALEGLQALFAAVAQPESHEVKYISHQNQYQLQLHFGANRIAFYHKLFANEHQAIAVRNNLRQLFSAEAGEESIIVSKHEYRLVLRDSNGKPVRVSVARSDNSNAAFATSIASLRVPGDTAIWEVIDPGNKPSGKFCSNDKKKPEKLIDTDAFKIDIDNMIVGKPDKFNYELLDRNHTFKFRSLSEFNSEKQARADAFQLLMLMGNKENYEIKPGRRKKILVLNQGQPVAECLNTMESSSLPAFVDKIHAIISGHFYKLSAEAFPSRWKFAFELGFEPDDSLKFESVTEYADLEEARDALLTFRNSLPEVALEVVDSKFAILTNDQGIPVLVCTFVAPAVEGLDEEEKLRKAKQLLEFSKQAQNQDYAGTRQSFNEGVQIDALSRTGTFVYRLIDKDNSYAKHIVDGNVIKSTVPINELYQQAQSGYHILYVCLGGDITEAVSDIKKGTIGYRYLIRCRIDFRNFKNGTILFKSVAVYKSKEEAEKEFNEYYLQIIDKARSPENYGRDNYIIFEGQENEKRFTTEISKPLVFVPLEIQEKITDGGIITKLVEATRAYPVRILKECSDEHKKLYPDTFSGCAGHNDQCFDATAPHKSPVAKYRYYFTLYNIASSSDDWRSIKLYRTPQEAMYAFYYFLVLLKYKGNYSDTTDDNNVKVVLIREVLAESTIRFATENDAWGPQGVEKFICIAQTPDSFHSLVRANQGDFTFDVACYARNGFHPCKYPSPALRDKVLEKLFSSFKNFITEKLFRVIKENNSDVIYAINGNVLAELPPSDGTVIPTDCQRIRKVLNAAGNDQNYKKEDTKWALIKDGILLASAAESIISKDEWKRDLLLLAFYFPIQKIGGKYRVEIKIPGFNTPDNNQVKVIPGCGAPNILNEDSCHVAWQSGCDYDTCDAAFVKWEEMCALLSGYENYRPYFDCTCYSYGIGLQTSLDIIARSPQHYTSAEILCDAIKRSKNLVNCEGLRLVEHILLRPRVKSDCVCDFVKPGNFAKITNCNDLKWEEATVVKGVESSQNICFAPGDDPFSFIATVLVPAWPERFRRKENKDLLEMILYREAPAHVLLRIVWLTPQDMSVFDVSHRRWLNAMQTKDAGAIESTACSLMTFLFKEHLGSSECTDCLPCPQTVVAVGCMPETSTDDRRKTSADRLLLINELYTGRRAEA